MTPQTTNKIATLKSFKGFWSRGGFDSCPPDHFTRCENCVFPGDAVAARESLQVTYSGAPNSITSFFVYSTAVATAVSNGYPMIYLDDGGNLWDAGTHPKTLIQAFGVNCNAFTAVEIAGRVFLSPKSGTVGLPGEYTYFWDGIDINRLGGPGPSTAVTLAQANAGIVDAGVHQIAVSFEYANGYLSPPYDVTNAPIAVTASIDSDGTHDIEVSNIPIGPGSAVNANIVARVLLMTLANQSELFFVPGGRIPDNTNDGNVTPWVINVPDTALIASADYLNDIKITVPSCASLKFYKGRMVFIGPSDFPFIQKLSRIEDFESTDSIAGVINTPRDNALNAPNTAVTINNVLYFLKPYGTYATQDNGGNPATWDLTIVDAALGSYDTGISLFSSGLTGQDIEDTCFVVHPHGLVIFNGFYQNVELSWKISDYWKTTVTPATFPYVRIANDVVAKRFYIVLYSTGILLVMDYADGMTPAAVRWSVWTTGIGTFSSTAVVLDQANKYTPLFCFGNPSVSNASLYTLDATKLTDTLPNGSADAFTQIITTALVASEEGAVTCFTGLRFRITNALSTGLMGITLLDEDNKNSTVINQFNLSNYSSQDLFRGINYTNEKMMIQLVTLGTASIYLKRLDIFGNKQWSVRPVMTQTT